MDQLIQYVLELPLELPLKILSNFTEEELSSICCLNRDILNICFNIYPVRTKKWSNIDFIIFKIKLINRLPIDQSIGLKDELNKELIHNIDFMNLVRIIANNATIKLTDNSKPGVDQIINTKYIMFTGNFNRPIDLRCFVNLKHLIFNDDFNSNLLLPIPIYNCWYRQPWIGNLQRLSFGNKFNQLLDLTSLTKLKSLSFGNSFNQKITKNIYTTDGAKIVSLLPDNLTDITFGNNFNQQVDNLPINLIELFTGNMFNQSVDKLPKNLEVLHLNTTWSGKFNQSIDNLPITLNELCIYGDFNQKIDKLPNGLNILILNETRFNKSICSLPVELDKLKLGILFKQLINKLPPNICIIIPGQYRYINKLKKKVPMTAKLVLY